MSWEAVIGLEIHVQLATASKIFSPCPVGDAEAPNVNIDPVSTGQPGVLPVLNERAVELAIRTALALNCTVHAESIFARKHYFYPDLPKGYQISQYDRPYAEHGWLDIDVDGETKRIGITRIHMEEDAGKTVHADGHSYVDFNRAGSPLVEIVTDPDVRSAREAATFMREVHAIVRAIGSSDGDLEKGNFRCDANVSVRRRGDDKLGTRTELKNINSFRFIERAVQYEIDRQIALIESGQSIVQQTRLWDADRQRTYAMRDKEEAHDYRYFPDPDLPPLVVAPERIEQIRTELPELPQARRARFREAYELSSDDALTLTGSVAISDFFEATISAGAAPRAAANWTINEVLAVTDDPANCAVTPARLASLLALVDKGTISGKIAKTVFQKMLEDQRHPEEIVEAEGLVQISDSGALSAAVQKVIDANPDEVARYRGGEKKLLGFFMGQVMRETQGKANPQQVQQLLREALDNA